MYRIILITGASSGLGKETAGFLAAQGHTVYGTSRNPGESLSAVKMVRMDITDDLSVRSAISEIISHEGRIDVVVNNAGIGIGGAIESFSDEEVNLQMNTNFNGLVRVTRAVLPHMRTSGSGKIINISSIGGLIGLPFQGFYSAAKFAIEGYSEALAMELKPWNIPVIVVNPGDFKTGFTGSRTITARDASGSDYRGRVTKAVEIMGQDEQSGCDPLLLAKTISKIISRKKPAYRYLVGRFDQRLIARIRHLLPPGLVRWIIADHYGI
ncbi:MAG TPA: oxidoreductase [Bacteroidales bacterium]|nr:oxidoreductase [Bacteroidales bacterium]